MLTKEGKNWRLIFNPSKGKYCFLIGINNWAIELKKNEFYSLFKVLNKLDYEFFLMKDALMDEELINIEVELLPWYIELEGNKNQWSLRIIYEGSGEERSFEMYWPIPIAQTLFFEIRKMWDSMHENY